MKSRSKYEHFSSETHSSFENSNTRWYTILKHNFGETDEIMGKYVISYIKIHEEIEVRGLLKSFTTINRVRYFRTKHSSLYYQY